MAEVAIAGLPQSGKTLFFRAVLELRPTLTAADARFELPVEEGLEIIKKEPFKLPVPVRNYLVCAGCALCQKSCPFGAIYEEDLWIDLLECEGCGLCVHLCPNKALQLANMQVAELIEAREGERKFFKAQLFPGARGTPQLVKAIREQARKEAPYLLDLPSYHGKFLLYALDGTDLVVLFLTPEEQAFLLLKRVSYLAPRARLLVVLSRMGTNQTVEEALKKEISSRGIEVLGELPLMSEEELKGAFQETAQKFLALANL